MRVLLLCCALLMIALPVGAREIAGVDVAETLQTDNGTTLHLNGAGIRKKLFFDIYIAQLYMEQPSNSTEGILGAAGQKRMVMHFLYKKVEKEKLIDGWDEGFEGNCTADELPLLQERMTQFNGLFVDVKKNDVIVLDFSPATGTSVVIAGEEKGIIEGKDFNDALLKIWLGKKPVASGLKKKLLDLAI
jgi:hypothetical protein